MSMFIEVNAFLARAYPGSKVSKESPFLDFEAPHYRKLVCGKEQVVANELFRESCWLVTVGSDPRPLLSGIDAIEQRVAYFAIDYGKEAQLVQWVMKVRGPFDLEAFHQAAGQGTTLLIAPASERMIDQAHLSFFASSAADLERAVAAHAESFRSIECR